MPFVASNKRIQLPFKRVKKITLLGTIQGHADFGVETSPVLATAATAPQGTVVAVPRAGLTGPSPLPLAAWPNLGALRPWSIPRVLTSFGCGSTDLGLHRARKNSPLRWSGSWWHCHLCSAGGSGAAAPSLISLSRAWVQIVERARQQKGLRACRVGAKKKTTPFLVTGSYAWKICVSVRGFFVFTMVIFYFFVMDNVTYTGNTCKWVQTRT